MPYIHNQTKPPPTKIKKKMANCFFYEFFREAREQELKQNGLVCPIARRGHWGTVEEEANRMLLEPMPELESESDSDSDCGPVLFGLP
jgi:hypothetical protein